MAMAGECFTKIKTIKAGGRLKCSEKTSKSRIGSARYHTMVKIKNITEEALNGNNVKQT